MTLNRLSLTLSHFIAAKWRWRFLHGERLRAFQDARARRIVDYAAHHAPFYHRHWADHDRREWRTLPVVDKGLMMTNFAEVNSVGISHTDARAAAEHAEQGRDMTPLRDHNGRPLTAGLSSGTSGERGLFLVSEQEKAAWAGALLARVLHGLPRHRLRVAFFLRANSNLYASVNNPLLALRYYPLTQSLAATVAALNSAQPTIVVGPPSLLQELAEQQVAGALRVQPSRLIAVAEILEPQDHIALEQAFGVPVHQIYQCTEGLLAISCVHGSLHIQEDLVALQFEQLPPGPDDIPRYTPIVTDLWRTTQPMVRYRLGDIVQLAPEPCPCGSAFRVLSAVEGRVADICYIHTAAGERLPLYPAQLSQLIHNALPNGWDYLVTQARDNQFTVALKAKTASAATIDWPVTSTEIKRTVQAALTTLGAQSPAIAIQQGLPDRPATEKRRRVQRVAA